MNKFVLQLEVYPNHWTIIKSSDNFAELESLVYKIKKTEPDSNFRILYCLC